MRPQVQAEVSLLEFWEATRLRAEQAKSAPESTVDFRAVLSSVLAVGCGRRQDTVLSKAGVPKQARTTPSAGALYPFEVLISLREGGHFRTYLYDVDTARITRLPANPPVAAADLLTGARLDTPDGHLVRAVVTLVARPWLSMAKYGSRGYLYTYLDIGHAATSLATAGQAAGFAPVVHLRFRRRWLAETLALGDACREPQVVITLAEHGTVPHAEPVEGPVPSWHDAQQAAPQLPGAGERANWESIREVSTYYAPVPVPRLGHSAILAEPRLPEGIERVSLRSAAHPDRSTEQFATVALRRRSAKGFLAKSVSLSQVDGLFEGMAEQLHTDCADPDGPGVGIRILVRNVDELAPGPYAYSPGRHALHPLTDCDDPAIDDDEVTSTCMGQTGLRNAAALIHVHATVRSLLHEQGRAGLAEIHFKAAHAAHQLCLNAARHTVGLTPVGGFDELRCARMALLPDGDEVIYVLALGVADVAARKLDQVEIAYSHGMTTAAR